MPRLPRSILAAALVALVSLAATSFAGEEKEYTPPIPAVKVNGETVPAETIHAIYDYWLAIYKGPNKPLSNEFRDKLASVAREQAVRTAAVRQYLEKNNLTLPPETVKADFEAFKAEIAASGTPFDEFLKKKGKTEAEFLPEFALRAGLKRATAADVEKDMEAVKKGFEKEKEKLPLRRASQIRFTYEKSRYTGHPERPKEDAQKMAAFALERLKKGEDFASLAKQLSDEKVSADLGGDMGWIAANAQPKALVSAIYALGKAGDLADVVETDQGFHVAKLTEVKSEDAELQIYIKRLIHIRTLAAETRLGKEAKCEVDKPAEAPKTPEPEKKVPAKADPEKKDAEKKTP